MGTPFTNGIFFDNDQNNIDDVSSYFGSTIECVKVGETEDLVEKQPAYPVLVKYFSMVDPTRTNKYIDLVKLIGDEKYDERSGMTDIDIMRCIRWCSAGAMQSERRASEATSKVAIFDWDRTLTLVEGFTCSNSLNDTVTAIQSEYEDEKSFKTLNPDQLAEDMLLYLLGGVDRAMKLRQMFKVCRENGVAVHILTNNKNATKQTFNELLYKLIGRGRYTLHYSGGEPEGKGKFLSDIREFKSMYKKNPAYQANKDARRNERRAIIEAKKDAKKKYEEMHKKETDDLYGDGMDESDEDGMDGGSPKRKRTRQRKSKRRRTKKTIKNRFRKNRH